jgi:squalene cyclase
MFAKEALDKIERWRQKAPLLLFPPSTHIERRLYAILHNNRYRRGAPIIAKKAIP